MVNFVPCYRRLQRANGSIMIEDIVEHGIQLMCIYLGTTKIICRRRVLNQTDCRADTRAKGLFIWTNTSTSMCISTTRDPATKRIQNSSHTYFKLIESRTTASIKGGLIRQNGVSGTNVSSLNEQQFCSL